MAKVVCAGLTDVGQKRDHNEDAMAVRPELGMLAVADGMGGAASGEVASKIYIDCAIEVFSDTAYEDLSVEEMVQKVFALAHQTILDNARNNEVHKGMGCTAELLAFDGDYYVLGHVGDSRTYLYRDGTLKQLTKDHSIVQDQIDRGLLKPEDARTHSLRNVIVRAVGVEESFAIDMVRNACQKDDIFLLCSDGLTDMLKDDEITQVILASGDLAGKAEGLIRSANEAGGKDNITVVLCQIV